MQQNDYIHIIMESINLIIDIWPLHDLQVVQEYERAVIFRLGRLKSGGAKVRSPHPSLPSNSLVKNKVKL